MRLSRRTLLSLTAGAAARDHRLPVAGIATAYTHNSHADVILSRLLLTETLDGMGPAPGLRLASLYLDQRPAGDIGEGLARRHGVPVFRTIREALTLGGEHLAVSGVLLIGEHGSYGTGPWGQELYPRKRFFDETVALFEHSGRTVPVFMDKHLSHDWAEGREIAAAARRLRIPLMAGSSVPGTWRRPAVDVRGGASLREIAAVSYHTLYGYGFHALEMVQCLAERREGGETGVRRVQCLEGDAVWAAGAEGRYDPDLLRAALNRLTRKPPAGQDVMQWIRASVARPVVFLIEYRDGLRASIFTLNYSVGEWAAAWKEKGDREPGSTLFWTQEERPLGHFTFLLRGIEQMIRSRKPAWPMERTLLTTGMMHFLLQSRHEAGRAVETPELDVRYRPTWRWRDPGPPPPGRPLSGP